MLIRLAKDRIKDMIAAAVRNEMATASRNIAHARARRLAAEAADFVEDHMGYAREFRSKYDLLAASLQEIPSELAGGLYCEFGVYQGRTINFIASKVAGPVHGFDSFEGLPEDWRPGVMRGHFKTGRLPQVRPNVQLHRGWFCDTLPPFAAEHAGPLAFAHIDADLYSSTNTIFNVLGSRIVPGTVLQFDEFFNYPGWRNGEYRAFNEFAAARRLEARYIGFVTGNSPAQMALSVVSVAD